MMKKVLLTIILSILYIHFFLISRCECPDANNPNGENIIGEDPDEEEYVFQCEGMVYTPPRTFKVGSRPHKVQAGLGYLGKPSWPSQWIMTEELFQVEGIGYGPSMNIAKMHRMNYKGENVGVVIIANSAVNCAHEQIHLRCKTDQTTGFSLYPRKSIFAFGKRHKKYRKCSPKSLASTAAGIIGMTDEGNKCGVGIAPKCIIGNIVIQPSSSNGSPENSAYKMSTKANSLVALYVHAWQLPQHDYRKDILLHWGKFEYMNYGSETFQLKPHVMGSGDLGMIANSCQTNEYTSADSSFVYGSVGYNGYLTPYSETCASLMGVTYSTTNGFEFYNEIVTIPSSNNVLTTTAPKGTTIVSAAIAGGIMVLIIDCYRKEHGKDPSVIDLIYILAFSANSEALQNKNMIWLQNAAGLRYSPQGGFGLPDLAKAYALIPIWTSLGTPRMYTCSRSDKTIQFTCEANSIGRRSLTYTSNRICRFSILDAPPNYHIITVTVEITAKLMKRGSMTIYLISPGGTVSCLLEGRPYDTTRSNYKRLRLRSNHFIGEHLLGQWTIKIFTYKENSIPNLPLLNAFKEGLQSTSSPPAPPNSDGNQINPADASSPLLVKSQPSPDPSKSHVEGNPKPEPAPPPVASSTEGQQSQLASNGDSSHPPNSVTSHPQQASPPAVSSIQNQQSQSTTKDGSSPVTGDPQPAPSAAAQAPQTQVRKETNPYMEGGPPHFSANAAPADGKPVQSSPSKPPSNSRTNATPRHSSQAKPYPRTNREKIVTEVGPISFRFLLAENLPAELKIKQQQKSTYRRDFEFELIKAWADFRQYLLVQTDPRNTGTRSAELENVYGITNDFMKDLLKMQADFNAKAEAATPLQRLHTLIPPDSMHHVTLQPSDPSAKAGVHPQVSPNQEIQNGVAAIQGEHQPEAPSSGAKQ